MSKPWTKSEDAFLRENWQKIPTRDISEKLKRSINGCQTRARKIQLKNYNRRWSCDEDEFIKEHYFTIDSKSLVEILDRTHIAISQRARDLGIRYFIHHEWSKEEEELLRTSNYKCFNEIAMKLNRTLSSVRAKSERMGLENPRGYKKVDVAFMIDNWDELTSVEIGKVINKSQGSITRKAKDLGLPNKYTTKATRARKREIMKSQWGEEEFRKRMERIFASKSYQKRKSLGMAHRPTKPEKKLEEILDSNFPGEYRYNGNFNSETVIGGLIPDFINVNGRKHVVEMFGDYWHRDGLCKHKGNKFFHSQTEDGRKEILGRFGFKCTIIWESELDNEEGVAEKIRGDWE